MSDFIALAPLPQPPPAHRPRRLSEEIDALLAALSERPISLREIIAVIQGRAYTLLLLLLPLPIPFSNLIPALAIIFLAAALMERDGLFIVAGIIMFGVTLLFFGGIFFGGVAVVNWLQEWFGGVFQPDEMPPPELPLPVPTTERGDP